MCGRETEEGGCDLDVKWKNKSINEKRKKEKNIGDGLNVFNW